MVTRSELERSLGLVIGVLSTSSSVGDSGVVLGVELLGLERIADSGVGEVGSRAIGSVEVGVVVAIVSRSGIGDEGVVVMGSLDEALDGGAGRGGVFCWSCLDRDRVIADREMLTNWSRSIIVDLFCQSESSRKTWFSRPKRLK